MPIIVGCVSCESGISMSKYKEGEYIINIGLHRLFCYVRYISGQQFSSLKPSLSLVSA
jgi:hypothetical protein